MFCALEEKPPSDSEVALHITICDTGVGMEQDFLQEIFKPYVQADAVLQGIGMGAGLDIPKLTEAIQNSAPLPPTTAGWWGEQTPPALYKSKAGGVCWLAYSGVIGQGRDCRYSGGKLVQGQKRVVLGGVIAAAHLWADEGHAVPHIEYIVGNQRVRVLRGADGAA